MKKRILLFSSFIFVFVSAFALSWYWGLLNNPVSLVAYKTRNFGTQVDEFICMYGVEKNEQSLMMVLHKGADGYLYCSLLKKDVLGYTICDFKGLEPVISEKGFSRALSYHLYKLPGTFACGTFPLGSQAYVRGNPVQTVEADGLLVWYYWDGSDFDVENIEIVIPSV